jgi:hypothetical protein
MEERRGAYRVLVEKPQGKRKLGRPRHRQEDNIKIETQEIGWEDLNWINLAQDSDRWWTVQDAVVKSQVP